MSKPIVCVVLVAAAFVMTGCKNVAGLWGEPSLPEPQPASWEKASAPEPMAAAPRTEPGRDFWQEESRRRGIAPTNPDYGHMRPGHQASTVAWRRSEWAEPLPTGDWAAPIPTGDWGGDEPAVEVVEVTAEESMTTRASMTMRTTATTRATFSRTVTAPPPPRPAPSRPAPPRPAPPAVPRDDYRPPPPPPR